MSTVAEVANALRRDVPADHPDPRTNNLRERTAAAHAADRERNAHPVTKTPEQIEQEENQQIFQALKFQPSVADIFVRRLKRLAELEERVAKHEIGW